MHEEEKIDHANDIAIIGMAARLPGAENVDEYWRNLVDGKDCMTRFSREDLIAAGVAPCTVDAPDYVRVRGVVADADAFDARFFEVTPRDARIMDPQMRLFLECAWHAIEDAGYDPLSVPGRVGLFGGSFLNRYVGRVWSDEATARSLGAVQLRILSDKDFMTTWVSYKLDLRGPSVAVQTACSTSLVAVHMACQSILDGESDCALAGGATIDVPQRSGYRYRDGSIESASGRCRPFDARADGTVSGNGVAIVFLKPLRKAREDQDPIYAVIKGSAVNNDGNRKVGYTAPSVAGQVEVIAEALAVSNVDAGSVGHVEAHGTGTNLGDQVEVAALGEVYASSRGKRSIASVKAIIGHLDAAAGAASLIKSALILKHGHMPPTTNCETPNPALELEQKNLFVDQVGRKWGSGESAAHIGVSSFGVGGTNAHLILGPPPQVSTRVSAERPRLIVLSAKTERALERAARRVAARLEASPGTDFGDVCHTLQVGRRAFAHRHALVANSVSEASRGLRGRATSDGYREDGPLTGDIVFMFPGQGAQYSGMGRELYANIEGFRRTADECLETLREVASVDLGFLFATDPDPHALSETELVQPALFVVEYALAKTWLELGVVPKAMIGHSLGEFVCACLAGVFRLEDALSVVAARARMMGRLPTGDMMAVPLDESRSRSFVSDSVSVAAVNGPNRCVVSGPSEAIADVEASLAEEGIAGLRLDTSHAFHSPMVEPMLDGFREHMRGIALRRPRLRFVSTVSGDWIRDEEAVDREYWVRHVRETVRFGDGVLRLLRDVETPAFLEVGPGRVLCTLVRTHPQVRERRLAVLSSLKYAKEPTADLGVFLNAVGRVWQAGVDVDWRMLQRDGRRVSLPGYPFERERHWIDESGRALPTDRIEPAHESPSTEIMESEPAEDALTRRLCTIWAEIFGLDEVRLQDDFFDLGGTSLIAVQLMAKIRDELGCTVPFEAIFDAPTVDQLALFMQSTRIDDVPVDELEALLRDVAETPDDKINPNSRETGDEAPDIGVPK